MRHQASSLGWAARSAACSARLEARRLARVRPVESLEAALVEELPISRENRPLFHRRWRQALPGGDAWIVAAASGSRPLPPGLIGEHQGGRVLPMAFTNPVYIDGDGDGVWRPQIAQPDPGPLGPAPLLPEEYPTHGSMLESCEPPLGVDPASWATP